MNSHLKTAHDYGVKKALEQCGYSSVEEVQKEAAAIGINLEPEKTAQEQPRGDSLDALFQHLYGAHR